MSDLPAARRRAVPARHEAALARARADLAAALAPGLAHDLRQPLTAILAFATALRRDPRLPEDLRASTDLLAAAGERAGRATTTLLELLRGPGGAPRAADPAALVREAAGLAAAGLPGLDVRLDLPDHLPEVLADPPLVRHALVACLAVAASGGAAGARRSVTLRATAAAGGGVRVVVASLGRPADPPRADLPPLLRPLPAALGAGGAGLEPAGGGWTLALPGAPEAAAVAPPARETRVAAPAAEPAVPGTPAPPPPGGPRVLVVDDEPMIRAVVGRALRARGLDVVLAEDGRAAVEVVEAGGIGAVLADHRMPGMDGLALQAVLAERVPALARRFALMSGDPEDPAVRAWAAADGALVLAKPFGADEAAAVVARLLAADGGVGSDGS